MSSPEASIEEILASIRKTFTDEPEAEGSKPAAPVAEPRSNGLPPFRSATETTASSGASLLPTPPRSRVAAIDDDLDDLIDKPASKLSATPAFIPQPSTPPPPSALSSVDAAREKWANLLNPQGTSNGSAAKAPEAKADIAPQPLASTPAPSPAPSMGLFAPRKGGFYPPQDTRPEPTLPIPSSAPAAPVAAPVEKAASPSPVVETSAAPAQPAPTSTPPRPGFIPYPQSRPSPAPEPTAAASTASAPLTEVPAASARALDDLVAELNNAAHVPSETAAPLPAMAPEPQAPALAVAPSPEPAALVSPVSAPASAAAATETSPTTAASRSFEDVVADMLRPLLERWIDENMPRIVERALQRDAALGRKPGQ